MPAAIGLDIGTFAVRAGELSIDGAGTRLVRFGQLTLPPGSVVAGEVIDVDVVASTLRRLWERVGFHGRRVVLGLANQRVIVRQADMPNMSEADLAAALRFEAADLLPIATEEATVDFQVLHEFVSPTGEARLQLLLAAAQRTMLDTHLRACELAGLRVVRADPMPLALVRAAGRTGMDVLAEEPAPEAIVCVGAGITTIVVHEDGVPRFSRFVSEGAAGATDAVATELGVDLDTAEDLKRRVGAGAPGGGDDRADLAVSRVVTHLVDEIDSSLRFFTSQSGGAELGRVLLTGAGSRLAGLQDRLAAMTGVPVVLARPGSWMSIEAGLSEEEAARAEPNLASVIGLALAAFPPATGRRINLLPVEVSILRVHRGQLIGGAATVVGLAVILGALWALRGGQITDKQRAASDAQARVGQLNQQIAQLGPVTQLQTDLAKRDRQVLAALSGDVDWTRLLESIATALPDDVWLTSFTGSSANGGPTATISVAGKGLAQTSTAAWIQRINDLASITNLWVPNSAGGGPGQPVSFSSTANLTTAANSDRIGNYTGSAQP